jgi:hypothetical protein
VLNMRRRSMLMTLAGAGVGLCVPLVNPLSAEIGMPADVNSLPHRMVALRAQMVDLSQRTTGTLQESADEVAGLCDVVLRRFEKNGASSPAILQRCADMLNAMRPQLSDSKVDADHSALITAHRDSVLNLIGSTEG